jgi:uncharacterized OB-fold protein
MFDAWVYRVHVMTNDRIEVLKHGIGYDLVVHRTTGRLVMGIRCHTCGRVSYHPTDIDERYCGACKAYYETGPGQIA